MPHYIRQLILPEMEALCEHMREQCEVHGLNADGMIFSVSEITNNFTFGLKSDGVTLGCVEMGAELYIEWYDSSNSDSIVKEIWDWNEEECKFTLREEG